MSHVLLLILYSIIKMGYFTMCIVYDNTMKSYILLLGLCIHNNGYISVYQGDGKEMKGLRVMRTYRRTVPRSANGKKWHIRYNVRKSKKCTKAAQSKVTPSPDDFPKCSTPFYRASFQTQPGIGNKYQKRSHMQTRCVTFSYCLQKGPKRC